MWTFTYIVREDDGVDDARRHCTRPYTVHTPKFMILIIHQTTHTPTSVIAPECHTPLQILYRQQIRLTNVNLTFAHIDRTA